MMLRSLHRLPGLFGALFLIIVTLSGAALSVVPAYQVATATPAVAGLSVADLAARVLVEIPNVEQISRAPSGAITAYYTKGDQAAAVVIDPTTGAAQADYTQSKLLIWLTDLHRAFLLGDPGRWGTAVVAVVMALMAISGVALVARRVGGLRRWFARLRGPLAGRLHVEISRVAVPGLLLSALTALFMTANSFDWLPADAGLGSPPQAVSGQMGFAPAQMAALQGTSVDALRDLTFPYAGDATDVFTLQTDAGEGYVDQGNGQLLIWVPYGPWQQAYEFIYMLHAGQGAWWLGLILGLAALGVPALAVTGAVQWVARAPDGATFARQCGAGRGADGDFGGV
jgi:sulfite reductase (NADPH) flavoprotein alpha-component